MTKQQYQSVLAGLTTLERAALESAFKSSKGNGHDFGYSDDVKVAGCNAQANGALVTNLITKGIIFRDDEFGQIMFTPLDGNDSYDFHFTARVVAEYLQVGCLNPGWTAQ